MSHASYYLACKLIFMSHASYYLVVSSPPPFVFCACVFLVHFSLKEKKNPQEEIYLVFELLTHSYYFTCDIIASMVSYFIIHAR